MQTTAEGGQQRKPTQLLVAASLTERNHDQAATQQRQPDHERVPRRRAYRRGATRARGDPGSGNRPRAGPRRGAFQGSATRTRGDPAAATDHERVPRRWFLTSRDNQHSGAPAARTHREPITFGAALVVLGATSPIGRPSGRRVSPPLLPGGHRRCSRAHRAGTAAESRRTPDTAPGDRTSRTAGWGSGGSRRSRSPVRSRPRSL